MSQVAAFHQQPSDTLDIATNRQNKGNSAQHSAPPSSANTSSSLSPPSASTFSNKTSSQESASSLATESSQPSSSSSPPPAAVTQSEAASSPLSSSTRKIRKGLGVEKPITPKIGSLPQPPLDIEKEEEVEKDSQPPFVLKVGRKRSPSPSSLQSQAALTMNATNHSKTIAESKTASERDRSVSPPSTTTVLGGAVIPTPAQPLRTVLEATTAVFAATLRTSSSPPTTSSNHHQNHDDVMNGQHHGHTGTQAEDVNDPIEIPTTHSPRPLMSSAPPPVALATKTVTGVRRAPVSSKTVASPSSPATASSPPSSVSRRLMNSTASSAAREQQQQGAKAMSGKLPTAASSVIGNRSLVSSPDKSNKSTVGSASPRNRAAGKVITDTSHKPKIEAFVLDARRLPEHDNNESDAPPSSASMAAEEPSPHRSETINNRLDTTSHQAAVVTQKIDESALYRSCVSECQQEEGEGERENNRREGGNEGCDGQTAVDDKRSSASANSKANNVNTAASLNHHLHPTVVGEGGVGRHFVAVVAVPTPTATLTMTPPPQEEEEAEVEEEVPPHNKHKEISAGHSSHFIPSRQQDKSVANPALMLETTMKTTASTATATAANTHRPDPLVSRSALPSDDAPPMAMMIVPALLSKSQTLPSAKSATASTMLSSNTPLRPQQTANATTKAATTATITTSTTTHHSLTGTSTAPMMMMMNTATTATSTLTTTAVARTRRALPAEKNNANETSLNVTCSSSSPSIVMNAMATTATSKRMIGDDESLVGTTNTISQRGIGRNNTIATLAATTTMAMPSTMPPPSSPPPSFAVCTSIHLDERDEFRKNEEERQERAKSVEGLLKLGVHNNNNNNQPPSPSSPPSTNSSSAHPLPSSVGVAMMDLSWKEVHAMKRRAIEEARRQREAKEKEQHRAWSRGRGRGENEDDDDDGDEETQAKKNQSNFKLNDLRGSSQNRQGSSSPPASSPHHHHHQHPFMMTTLSSSVRSGDGAGVDELSQIYQPPSPPSSAGGGMGRDGEGRSPPLRIEDSSGRSGEEKSTTPTDESSDASESTTRRKKKKHRGGRKDHHRRQKEEERDGSTPPHSSSSLSLQPEHEAKKVRAIFESVESYQRMDIILEMKERLDKKVYAFKKRLQQIVKKAKEEEGMHEKKRGSGGGGDNLYQDTRTSPSPNRPPLDPRQQHQQQFSAAPSAPYSSSSHPLPPRGSTPPTSDMEILKEILSVKPQTYRPTFGGGRSASSSSAREDVNHQHSYHQHHSNSTYYARDNNASSTTYTSFMGSGGGGGTTAGTAAIIHAVPLLPIQVNAADGTPFNGVGGGRGGGSSSSTTATPLFKVVPNPNTSSLNGNPIPTTTTTAASAITAGGAHSLFGPSFSSVGRSASSLSSKSKSPVVISFGVPAPVDVLPLSKKKDVKTFVGEEGERESDGADAKKKKDKTMRGKEEKEQKIKTEKMIFEASETQTEHESIVKSTTATTTTATSSNLKRVVKTSEEIRHRMASFSDGAMVVESNDDEEDDVGENAPQHTASHHATTTKTTTIIGDQRRGTLPFSSSSSSLLLPPSHSRKAAAKHVNDDDRVHSSRDVEGGGNKHQQYHDDHEKDGNQHDDHTDNDNDENDEEDEDNTAGAFVTSGTMVFSHHTDHNKNKDAQKISDAATTPTISSATPVLSTPVPNQQPQKQAEREKTEQQQQPERRQKEHNAEEDAIDTFIDALLSKKPQPLIVKGQTSPAISPPISRTTSLAAQARGGDGGGEAWRSLSGGKNMPDASTTVVNDADVISVLAVSDLIAATPPLPSSSPSTLPSSDGNARSSHHHSNEHQHHISRTNTPPLPRVVVLEQREKKEVGRGEEDDKSEEIRGDGGTSSMGQQVIAVSPALPLLPLQPQEEEEKDIILRDDVDGGAAAASSLVVFKRVESTRSNDYDDYDHRRDDNNDSLNRSDDNEESHSSSSSEQHHQQQHYHKQPQLQQYRAGGETVRGDGIGYFQKQAMKEAAREKAQQQRHVERRLKKEDKWRSENEKTLKKQNKLLKKALKQQKMSRRRAMEEDDDDDSSSFSSSSSSTTTPSSSSSANGSGEERRRRWEKKKGGKKIKVSPHASDSDSASSGTDSSGDEAHDKEMSRMTIELLEKKLIERLLATDNGTSNDGHANDNDKTQRQPSQRQVKLSLEKLLKVAQKRGVHVALAQIEEMVWPSTPSLAMANSSPRDSSFFLLNNSGTNNPMMGNNNDTSVISSYLNGSNNGGGSGRGAFGGGIAPASALRSPLLQHLQRQPSSSRQLSPSLPPLLLLGSGRESRRNSPPSTAPNSVPQPPLATTTTSASLAAPQAVKLESASPHPRRASDAFDDDDMHPRHHNDHASHNAALADGLVKSIEPALTLRGGSRNVGRNCRNSQFADEPNKKNINGVVGSTNSGDGDALSSSSESENDFSSSDDDDDDLAATYTRRGDGVQSITANDADGTLLGEESGTTAAATTTKLAFPKRSVRFGFSLVQLYGKGKPVTKTRIAASKRKGREGGGEEKTNHTKTPLSSMPKNINGDEEDDDIISTADGADMLSEGDDGEQKADNGAAEEEGEDGLAFEPFLQIVSIGKHKTDNGGGVVIRNTSSSSLLLEPLTSFAIGLEVGDILLSATIPRYESPFYRIEEPIVFTLSTMKDFAKLLHFLNCLPEGLVAEARIMSAMMATTGDIGGGGGGGNNAAGSAIDLVAQSRIVAALVNKNTRRGDTITNAPMTTMSRKEVRRQRKMHQRQQTVSPMVLPILFQVKRLLPQPFGTTTTSRVTTTRALVSVAPAGNIHNNNNGEGGEKRSENKMKQKIISKTTSSNRPQPSLLANLPPPPTGKLICEQDEEVIDEKCQHFPNNKKTLKLMNMTTLSRSSSASSATATEDEREKDDEKEEALLEEEVVTTQTRLVTTRVYHVLTIRHPTGCDYVDAIDVKRARQKMIGQMMKQKQQLQQRRIDVPSAMMGKMEKKNANDNKFNSTTLSPQSDAFQRTAAGKRTFTTSAHDNAGDGDDDDIVVEGDGGDAFEDEAAEEALNDSNNNDEDDSMIHKGDACSYGDDDDAVNGAENSDDDGAETEFEYEDTDGYIRIGARRKSRVGNDDNLVRYANDENNGVNDSTFEDRIREMRAQQQNVLLGGGGGRGGDQKRKSNYSHRDASLSRTPIRRKADVNGNLTPRRGSNITPKRQSATPYQHVAVASPTLLPPQQQQPISLLSSLASNSALGAAAAGGLVGGGGAMNTNKGNDLFRKNAAVDTADGNKEKVTTAAAVSDSNQHIIHLYGREASPLDGDELLLQEGEDDEEEVVESGDCFDDNGDDNDDEQNEEEETQRAMDNAIRQKTSASKSNSLDNSVTDDTPRKKSIVESVLDQSIPKKRSIKGVQIGFNQHSKQSGKKGGGGKRGAAADESFDVCGDDDDAEENNDDDDDDDNERHDSSSAAPSPNRTRDQPKPQQRQWTPAAPWSNVAPSKRTLEKQQKQRATNSNFNIDDEAYAAEVLRNKEKKPRVPSHIIASRSPSKKKKGPMSMSATTEMDREKEGVEGDGNSPSNHPQQYQQASAAASQPQRRGFGYGNRRLSPLRDGKLKIPKPFDDSELKSPSPYVTDTLPKKNKSPARNPNQQHQQPSPQQQLPQHQAQNAFAQVPLAGTYVRQQNCNANDKKKTLLKLDTSSHHDASTVSAAEFLSPVRGTGGHSAAAPPSTAALPFSSSSPLSITEQVIGMNKVLLSPTLPYRYRRVAAILNGEENASAVGKTREAAAVGEKEMMEEKLQSFQSQNHNISSVTAMSSVPSACSEGDESLEYHQLAEEGYGKEREEGEEVEEEERDFIQRDFEREDEKPLLLSKDYYHRGGGSEEEDESSLFASGATAPPPPTLPNVTSQRNRRIPLARQDDDDFRLQQNRVGEEDDRNAQQQQHYLFTRSNIERHNHMMLQQIQREQQEEEEEKQRLKAAEEAEKETMQKRNPNSCNYVLASTMGTLPPQHRRGDGDQHGQGERRQPKQSHHNHHQFGRISSAHSDVSSVTTQEEEEDGEVSITSRGRLAGNVSTTSSMRRRKAALWKPF